MEVEIREAGDRRGAFRGDVDQSRGSCALGRLRPAGGGRLRHGEAYYLAAGAGLTATDSEISVDPVNATNPINTTHTITATLKKEAGPLVGQLVTFAASGANAGASGVCVPTATAAKTWTTTAPTTRRPPTTTTTPTTTPPPPPTKANIFQVEFRHCINLHVGYNFFAPGTLVHWNVTRQGRVVSRGQFRALGGKKLHHFLTQPLGVTLPHNPDGSAHFTWTVNGADYSYNATRAPGC